MALWPVHIRYRESRSSGPQGGGMALENESWGGQGACCVGVSDVVDGILGGESVLHIYDSLCDQVKTDRI